MQEPLNINVTYKSTKADIWFLKNPKYKSNREIGKMVIGSTGETSGALTSKTKERKGLFLQVTNTRY